jgi:hypothetical protein
MSDRAKRSFTIKQFSDIIRDLSGPTPQSDEFPVPARYANLKDQWLCWLREYLTPGYYDRQNAVDDAQWAYQHLNNGDMIVWLNEAAGEDARIIHAAIVAKDGREPPQTEAKYARLVLPWEGLVPLLFKPERIGR